MKESWRRSIGLDENILMTELLGAATLDFLRVATCHSSAPLCPPPLSKLGLSPVSTISGRKFLFVPFMGKNFVRKRCNNISKASINYKYNILPKGGWFQYMHTNIHKGQYVYILAHMLSNFWILAIQLRSLASRDVSSFSALSLHIQVISTFRKTSEFLLDFIDWKFSIVSKIKLVTWKISDKRIVFTANKMNCILYVQKL